MELVITLRTTVESVEQGQHHYDWIKEQLPPDLDITTTAHVVEPIVTLDHEP